jgi:hypothetical protein
MGVFMQYEKELDYIIHLLKCTITESTPKYPSNSLDWEVIYQFVLQHKISSTIYYSLVKLPDNIILNIPHYNDYAVSYKKNLILDTNRTHELSSIRNQLEKNGIDYILLKGSVTKNCYPDSSMRHMNDVDILFRGADFKLIDSIFNTLGYVIGHRDAKDTAYVNPITKVAVEMQPQLIDIGYSRWYKYLETIWDKCELRNDNTDSTDKTTLGKNRNNKHEYVMSKEDFFIYHIIHMAKHFINGGIGLIHIMDIHIMKSSWHDIDYLYIERELSGIGLHKFYLVISTLSENWFCDTDNNLNNSDSFHGGVLSLTDYQRQLITKYIFSSGAFGNTIQKEANIVAARGGKKSSLLKKIFPDINTMVNYYGTILDKHKFLLPFYWIKLNISRIMRSYQDRDILSSINAVSEKKVADSYDILDICGLKNINN